MSPTDQPSTTFPKLWSTPVYVGEGTRHGAILAMVQVEMLPVQDRFVPLAYEVSPRGP